MKLYSAKVRLSGSLYNEVRKENITAPEVHLLKILHGADSVVEVAETGKNKVAHAEERDRLIKTYAHGLVASQRGKTPEEAFNAIFGVAGRLPDDVLGAVKADKADKAAKPAKPAPEPEDDTTEDPES